jgi:hypothetical protein
VKRFLAVFLGGLGAGAFWRRKRHTAPLELGHDPAAELRARLAESKAVAVEAPPDDERPIAEQERSPLDPESRRRDVHERARAAADELG